jgi:hypothetical protein
MQERSVIGPASQYSDFAFGFLVPDIIPWIILADYFILPFSIGQVLTMSCFRATHPTSLSS